MATVPIPYSRLHSLRLANIIPIDDAVKFMKDAIKKTFGKKGDAIVNMNYAAVDAGLDGAVEVAVPAFVG